MPAIPIIMVAVAVAGTAASMAAQQAASKQAARTATNVANYNAAVDINNAKQTQIDSQTNIDRQRAQNDIYLSRQRSAIAASGVLEAGSPLDLMADTASLMEQGIQDEQRDTSMKMEGDYSAAAAGVVQGQASSDAYKIQGQASLFSGVGQLGQEGMGAYNSGAFGKVAGK